MTRIAHLADLHFGAVDESIVDALVDDLNHRNLDAVVVAGDLTMEASDEEFKKARSWLDRLKPACLVVPGNHDIPKWNILERFMSPFERFSRHIGKELRDEIILEHCVIYGLNTTASWQPHLKWQEGVARRKEIAAAAKAFARHARNKLNVVAAHHPLVAIENLPRARPIRRADEMLQLFAKHGVDLVLTGHTHQSFILPVADKPYDHVMVGAPTALSNRRRGEANGYWLIEFSQTRVALSLMLRSGRNFKPTNRHLFKAEGQNLLLP